MKIVEKFQPETMDISPPLTDSIHRYLPVYAIEYITEAHLSGETSQLKPIVLRKFASRALRLFVVSSYAGWSCVRAAI